MIDTPLPEIMRLSLDDSVLTVGMAIVWVLLLILQLKVLCPDRDVVEVMQTALDPPSISAIQHSIESLRVLGAVDAQGNVTSLGLLVFFD